MKIMLKVLGMLTFFALLNSCNITLDDPNDSTNSSSSSSFITIYNSTGYTIDNMYIITAEDYSTFSNGYYYDFDDMAYYYTDRLSLYLYSSYSYYYYVTMDTDEYSYVGYYLIAEDIYGEYYSNYISSDSANIYITYSDSEGYY